MKVRELIELLQILPPNEHIQAARSEETESFGRPYLCFDRECWYIYGDELLGFAAEGDREEVASELAGRVREMVG
jgi:hypothetical protein